jgi:RNA polymerase sigma-70 factor (ECF subfamily)
MGEPCEKWLPPAADDVKVDDEILIKRFNQDEGSAFEEIVAAYADQVAGLANRLLAWPGDVDDVVQDVFLAAFLNLKKFRGQCTLRTWLFTITINKCRTQRFRRALGLRILAKKALTPQAVSGPADSSRMDAETFEKVQQAVRALPMKYREPVVLRYLQEMSNGEAAKVLSISENTIAIRLNRARQRLKDSLAQIWDSDL